VKQLSGKMPCPEGDIPSPEIKNVNKINRYAIGINLAFIKSNSGITQFLKGGCMRVSHLAEAIILQSIQDLWDEEHRQSCVEFFTGEDFRTCAALAGMSTSDQIKIFNMFGGIMKGAGRSVTARKRRYDGYVAAVSELRRELAG
jgi:hypothetical protein